MNIDNDKEDLNDGNSNASTMTIQYYDTTSNSYGIFQLFLGEIPHFAPHGTLGSLYDSPNFNVAKMKQRWWLGITHAAPLELDLDLEGENSADALSL
jgi:hypothetical protein